MRQAWGVGIITAASVGALAATALWFQYQQQHFVSSSYAFVTAPSTWVRAATWERVLTVDVATGVPVRRGTVLMTVATAAGRHLTVLAPVAGRVGSVVAARGSEVAAAGPLVALVATRRASVEVELPESQTRRVRPGEAVTLTLAAYPGRTFHGRVARMGRATLAAATPALAVGGFAPATQWVPVWVTLPPPPLGVGYIAGESASAQIHV
ncbi:MAG: efflux RND transporter periplasmic adaptor subunit [Thermaerobacter sp.]|nr:efflux RND transporter periplasmic adaptor subunit [Thermaerobacter sp.]